MCMMSFTVEQTFQKKVLSFFAWNKGDQSLEGPSNDGQYVEIFETLKK